MDASTSPMFQRRRELGPLSAVLRDAWNYSQGSTTMENDPRIAHPLTEKGLGALLDRYWKVSGVKVSSRDGGFKAGHGFRKYFKTALTTSGIGQGYSEALLGHRRSYFKPADSQLEEAYSKALKNLTVGSEEAELLASQDKLRKELLALREDQRRSDERASRLEALLLQMRAEREGELAKVDNRW